MDIEEILNTILATKMTAIEPSHVMAEFVKGKGVEVGISGRGVDIIILSLIISRRIIKDTPTSYEEYCKVLKKAVEKEMEQKDELIEIQKIFKDVCVWEKL